MTKIVIDYNKTVIYKIVCNDLTIDEKYVGSTTNFRQRKSQHKNGCTNKNNKSYNLKLYDTIRNNGGWENWTMIEIEKFPCIDGNQSRSRERFWFEELNCKLNGLVPNRSKKEHYQDNQLQCLQNKKEYYQKNLVKIKEYCKQYKEKNQEYFKEYHKKYRLENKEQIIKYRLENKELKKEKRKIYTEKNKEKILKYQKEYREKIKLSNFTFLN